MAHYCEKCGTQTMLTTGYVDLEPDSEPYESGKEEKPRTDIDEINKYVSAQFCENCDEITHISSE